MKLKSKVLNILVSTVIFCLMIPMSSSIVVGEEIVLKHLGRERPPKHSYTTGSSNIVQGLCIDMFRALERIDPTLKFGTKLIGANIKRILFELESGAADVLCGYSKTEIRQETFIYIEPEIFVVNYIAVVRKDDDIKIESLDDIKNSKDYSILVPHGAAIAQWLKTQGSFSMVSGASDIKEALLMLNAGRGRLMMHNDMSTYYALKEHGLNDRLKILPVSFSKRPNYLLVRSDLSKATIERLSKAVKILHATGEGQRIYNKYVQ